MDIEAWLLNEETSPLDRSKVTIAGLRPNRLVRDTIADLVSSGKLDAAVCSAWREKGKAVAEQTVLGKARALFKAGNVLAAAKLGLPEAQGELARAFHFGIGKKKNLAKGIEWATKAARGGDGDSQFLLGEAFAQGEGVDMDNAEAAKYFELAALSSHHLASAAAGNLGAIYAGGGGGVRRDAKKAASWFRTGAEGGDVGSMRNLADCLYHGLGIRKDLVEARRWYTEVCEEGDEDGSAVGSGCLSKLGLMMLRGEGGIKVPGAGIGLLSKAAEDGCEAASAVLALINDALAGVCL